MILETWTLTADSFEGFHVCNNTRRYASWCRLDVMSTVRRFFNVPKNVEKLWVLFHDRPSKDRLPVVVEEFDDAAWCLKSGKREVINQSEGDSMLMDIQDRVGDRTLHVEVWYE